jgi:hypothetical protein
MKEKAVSFNAPMVRAVLANIKKMTRRVIKPQPTVDYDEYFHPHFEWKNYSNGFTRERLAQECPYGKVGDILYVKESAWMFCERRPNGKTKTGRDKWHYVPLETAPIFYQADQGEKPNCPEPPHPETGNVWCWRLKVARFMPRWASRITLRITDIRVERLQDISEEDARAEGCPYPAEWSGRYVDRDETAKTWFKTVWRSIHGNDPVKSWDSNPWLWVLSFERVK